MKRAAAAVLFVSLLAAQSTRSPAQQAYERANALFAKQQFAASLDAVEEALRLDAKFVPALTLRAKLALAARRNDLARADLERAVRLDPQSAYAQFLLGFVLYESNELRLAVQPLETAAGLNPKDARAALYLGLTRESLGDPNEAMAQYNRAIRLEESSSSGGPQVETLLIAARLHMVLDQLDEAERLVRKALSRDPQSRDAHFEAARLSLGRFRHESAAREAERALSLPATADTTDAKIHALLARCYQALGDSEKAQRHARAVQ